MLFNEDHPLKLMAIPGNYLKFNQRKLSKRYLSAVAEVQVAHGTSCLYCQKAQATELVNRDHDYMNNALMNFALACQLCTHVQLLDQMDDHTTYAEHIIYLPQISQHRLNQVYWQWSADLKEGIDKFGITEALAELSSQTKELDELICPEASIHDICGLLMSLYADETFMAGLRWVPDVDSLLRLTSGC